MSFVKKLLRCYSGSSEVLPARRVINNTQEQDFIARRVLCEHKVKGQGDKFLLFKYNAHLPIFNGYVNYGDYIQTIATELAVSSLFNPVYDFADRDSLYYYRMGEDGLVPICVMQGWFSHTLNFFPSEAIHPVWIGTHFDCAIHKYIREALVINAKYFQEGVGCRDLSTLNFLKGLGCGAYFSRCLTLTMPKRVDVNIADKVYFVDVPNSIMRRFPNQILERAIVKNQKWIKVGGEAWEITYTRAKEIIEDLKKASLVITSALHCASPCIAMGIPVLLISLNPEENGNRFSALSGIIESKTLEDLKKASFNYDVRSADIEDLKSAMLKNLLLTIHKSVGFDVSDSELQDIREYIANFKISEPLVG